MARKSATDTVAKPPAVKTTGILERRNAFAKNDPLRVVFVTAPEGEALKIARTFLEERLVACVNVVKGVQSLYWWEGKIEDSAETLLIMKTPASKINKLGRRVRELHSYTVPEFVALAVMEANPAYTEWVLKETESSVS
jgi:periplasmic divalent cation tolerance protein